ncbi:MAG: hypothetical protein EOR81_29695 [Mesorhizobium sp.]|nr:MAG: hypothetical protein EOR81_29695 [Mesorhizobium sp.]
MDMDDVQELVRRVRQKYVDQFVSAVGELAANSQGSHTTEVKFSNVDSFYRNFIAVDFVANDGKPNPQFINSDTYLKFSPDIRAEIGGMDALISPFKWDEVHFKFDTKDLDDDFFDEWFRMVRYRWRARDDGDRRKHHSQHAIARWAVDG